MTDIPEDDADSEVVLKRQILITKPGFYKHMTSAQYFAEPCPEAALTNSGIKLLLKDKPHVFALSNLALSPDSPEPADHAAKIMGDVCHQLTLGKGRGYAVGDFKTWASKDAKAFKAEAIGLGLTPLVKHKFEQAEKSAAVARQAIADVLAEIAQERGIPVPAQGIPYETEVVAAWIEQTEHGPVWCRIMMDVWCESLWVILDPKFTARIQDSVINPHMVNMGWDTQGVWYPRGIAALIPEASGKVEFWNVLTTPKVPFRARAVRINEGWRSTSETECERALSIFGACMKANDWPDHPLRTVIDIPSWEMRKRLESELDAETESDDDG